MVTGVVRPGIVSYPLVSGMNMRCFRVPRLIREMAFLRRIVVLCTALGSASFLRSALSSAVLFRPALSSAVLFRPARGSRIAADALRPASGRRSGVVATLRRATALLLSATVLSDTHTCD